MPRTRYHFISIAGILFATLALAESVAGGSGAPNPFLFFKHGTAADGPPFLEKDKYVAQTFTRESSSLQHGLKQALSDAQRLLSLEIDGSGITNRLAGISNTSVETNDLFEVVVDVDGAMDACYEQSYISANKDIAFDSIRPTRTSVYSDRPWSRKENVLGGMHTESVMYRVPIETRGTADTESEGDDYEEPVLGRKVVTASGNRVIIGGRASRDTRYRKGPRPTGEVRQSVNEISTHKGDHLGSMATVEPRSPYNRKDNNRPRWPRITSSPSADAHLSDAHAYDEIDESAVIFDKDSVVLMKLYGIIESLSDAFDDRLAQFGIAEKLRELPALWEQYSKQLDAYLKTPTSQSLGSQGSVTMLTPLTAARLLLAHWVDRYPATIMLLGLFFIMCLL
ncbi:hypothetical protein V1525DRAFT_208996 [Lipomyces kononenkoae]|uniref:Uncharacterized protein n=1 Tax=Lipomyces kononenkoae TaxID=34357 RepID=A0ACC3TAW1_LIPKO